MEKLKIDDLMNYKFLSGITASPAGKKAAFVGKKANEKKNSYDSWVLTEEKRMVSSSSNKRFFSAPKEVSFLTSSVQKSTM